jgi:hypothetical protein
MTALADKLALRDQFRAVLIEATRQRDQRRAIINTAWGPEIEWTCYEREQMRQAVNTILSSRGKLAVGVDVIRRIDMSASGHVDWLDKFALRCAELVTDQ